jgi:SAM-dependent methyltransferase
VSSREFHDQWLRARCRGKDVLECGCGPGEGLRRLAGWGARATGIDIADEAVRPLTPSDGQGDAPTPPAVLVMNVEQLSFEDATFDLVCGTGILHHLDLEKALPQIARTLRPDGQAIFLEPLGHNPVINAYRRLTPSMRTPDEHPLRMADIQGFDRYFGRVEAHFFHLCSLLAVPFRRTRVFGAVLKGLDSVDRAVFRHLPWARRHAWVVVLIMGLPRRPST